MEKVFYKMREKMQSIDFRVMFKKFGQEVSCFTASNRKLIVTTCAVGVILCILLLAVIDMNNGHYPLYDLLPYETCKNWWSNKILSVRRSSQTQSTNSIDVNKPLKNINDGVNLIDYNAQQNDKKYQKNHQEIVNYYHQG